MNKNNPNIEDDLLIRFIQSDVTPEEQTAIEEWLLASAKNQSHFDQVKSVWEKTASLAVFDQIDVDKNWNAVSAKLQLGKKEGRQVFMLPKLLRYAAAILLLAVAAFLITRNTGNSSIDMMTLTASNDIEAYELPDGTIVWLNEGSQLIYPSTFSPDERRIELKGQGFFDVAHDASHPFIVKTGETETKVLGTTFNLKGGKDNVATELVLVTGKVSFTKGAQELVLLPGEKVTIDNNGIIVKAANTNKNFMAWRTRSLVFENTAMEQVMKDIADLYGVTLTFEESAFKTCPLTTRFDGETLESVLETIELLFAVDIEQNGNTYIIKGSGC